MKTTTPVKERMARRWRRRRRRPWPPLSPRARGAFAPATAAADARCARQPAGLDGSQGGAADRRPAAGGGCGAVHARPPAGERDGHARAGDAQAALRAQPGRGACVTIILHVKSKERHSLIGLSMHYRSCFERGPALARARPRRRSTEGDPSTNKSTPNASLCGSVRASHRCRRGNPF